MPIIGMIWLSIIFNFQSSKNWTTFLVLPPTFVGILMPVLLGLTIRAHKKKKNHIIIPPQPFYHDDQYLGGEEIEMKDYGDFYNNDIFLIDPKIFVLERFKA